MSDEVIFLKELYELEREGSFDIAEDLIYNYIGSVLLAGEFGTLAAMFSEIDFIQISARNILLIFEITKDINARCIMRALLFDDLEDRFTNDPNRNLYMNELSRFNIKDIPYYNTYGL